MILTRRKKLKLATGQQSNDYPVLFSEMSRYCYLVKSLYFVFTYLNRIYCCFNEVEIAESASFRNDDVRS